MSFVDLAPAPAPPPEPAEPAAAERAALERTVCDLTTAPYVARPEAYGAETWSSVGGGVATGVTTAAPPPHGARTAALHVWAAEDVAQASLARAVSAYVRALRADGLRLRGVLVTVADVVRASASPTVSVGTLDDITRDARQYGVEAYFGR